MGSKGYQTGAHVVFKLQVHLVLRVASLEAELAALRGAS